MDIGKTMRAYRDKLGIKQVDMARKLGMRQQSLWKIETGRAIPKPATIEKFCEVAGIYRSELYIQSIGAEDLPPDKLDQSNILETLWFASAMIRRAKAREKIEFK